MYAIERAEMIRLEKNAIENLGIPSIVLMENAACGFVQALKSEYGDICGKKICVVCGKGNNAGDGYAIARLLVLSDANVNILPLFDIELLSDDAKTNATAAKNMRLAFIKNMDDEYDIIVDAIFGTGFRGSVASPAKEIIQKINASSAYIAAVDVPSGVALCDEANSFFVQCDLCVAFGYAKLYQLTGTAQSSFKKLVIAPISITTPDNPYTIINKETFALLPKRESISHKGTFGKVLAYTGSYGMAGAAILSGRAVLKSGAGMLTLAVPCDIVSTIAHEFPSAMTFPLSEGADVVGKANTMDALLIGCGLGTSNSTKETFRSLINCQKPMVIDADGLNILAENIEIIKNKNAILTPHIAEFSRLSGVSVDEIKRSPIKYLKNFCLSFGVCVILKDAVTLVCDKGEHLAVCHAPNSGMATAGSGDVLSGVVTALLAQGLDPFDAACAGVYVHSAAGAMAKELLGEAGMLSEDILNFVPKAFVAPCDIAPHIKEL